MDKFGSVSQWIEDLRAGNDEAATRLWDRYYERLIRLAKKRIDNFPRRSFDEEDVAAKALDDCYRSIQDGKYPDLHDRDDLWRLLIRITENEAKDQIRREKRQKRGDGGVRGDSALTNPDGADGDLQGFDQCEGPDPTPEFVVEMAENCSRLLAALVESKNRCRLKLQEIAILKLKGCTNKEIKDRIGVKHRTVERRLRVIRDIWKPEVD